MEKPWAQYIKDFVIKLIYIKYRCLTTPIFRSQCRKKTERSFFEVQRLVSLYVVLGAGRAQFGIFGGVSRILFYFI